MLVAVVVEPLLRNLRGPIIEGGLPLDDEEEAIGDVGGEAACRIEEPVLNGGEAMEDCDSNKPPSDVAE